MITDSASLVTLSNSRRRNPSALTRQFRLDDPSVDRRVRVLMLINKIGHGGGAERAMIALATHLPRDRFEVTVSTTRPTGGALLESVLAEGIPYLALDRTGRFDVLAFRRLVAFLRNQAIDVVHAHMFGSNLWGS